MTYRPTMLLATQLALADWLVLAGYGALLIGIGLFASRRAVRGADDYFLGGRAMPLWAVAISILSTAQSAATFVGVPQSAYAGDLRYLSSNIGGILAAVILAVAFIPAYYRLGVSTPYQLLESRFGGGRKGAGGGGARQAASLTYLIGRIFATGARIYVGAIPAAVVLFGADPAGEQRVWPLVVTIIIFMSIGVVISLMGGISSVIWVDVLQVTVYLGAAVATIIVLMNRIPAPLGEVVAGLASPPDGAPSKLTVLSLGLNASGGVDFSQEFTLLTALTGFALLTLASHGADQDLVQRMLTCKSAARGSWSVITGVLIGVPAVCIFLALGLLLHVFYQRPDLMGGAAPAHLPGSEKAFQVFALNEMRGGLAGLVVAGLFAAGPAGINSSLNAMASTVVSDLYRPSRPGRSEAHYLRVGRLWVVGWGLILGAFACLCIWWQRASGQTLISFVLSVMSFAYAGLLGVFLAALFTRRGSTRSVVAALLTGFGVVLLFQPSLYVLLSPICALCGGPDLSTTEGAKAAIPMLNWSYPWHLVIGVIASFSVCCLSGPERRMDKPAERR